MSDQDASMEEFATARPSPPDAASGSGGEAPDADHDQPEVELSAVELSAVGYRYGRALAASAAWLRSSSLGLVVMAMVVGVGAGFGAVGFRWLIYGFTWLVTGHEQFGQQGRVGSLHLPWLGIWFLLLVPIVGGLLYGPLIQRFAQEARGHGVPEVMLAVAENGGRIRPPVTGVKALASAVCIGFGGSVGREGPIVQIGSALASTMGQVVRMSESRLRILVACGAAGGISATFNAPITGLFFGFEIVLREFTLEALFATILSSVTADLISRAFFGSAPFFSQVPHDLYVQHFYTYLLVALVGVAAGLVGFGFKTFLYKLEDVMDAAWKGRPEWARPAVGGLALGVVLLILPQMYGVGYPVMDNAIGGHVVIWLLVVFMLGKILACSLSLSIGGSGGVFAPSLFVGAMGGMAFGLVVLHVFGHAVSSPAVFAMVAMGAVFGAAAQAPLTAISSVIEMTGNFTLIVPVMLAVGIATAVSRHLGRASIYTTKLLRRGIDIERPKATNVLQMVTVGDVMMPVTLASETGEIGDLGAELFEGDGSELDALELRVGRVTERHQPQVLFADETLDQALRQLVLYGHSGLPVVSADREHLRGWITRQGVLRVLADRVASPDAEAEAEVEAGVLASEFSEKDAAARLHVPSTPLDGYDVVEVGIGAQSPGLDRHVGDIDWPSGAVVVAVTEGREVVPARKDLSLSLGERVVLLVPNHESTANNGQRAEG